MMRVRHLSVAYIRPNSRTERPRKTKIGTEVAHVPLGHHFQGQRSKVNLHGEAGAYCGGLPHSLLLDSVAARAPRP